MAAGHTICRRKCKWWCPGLSDDEAATQHAVLAKAIPQSHGGLLLLGAGAQGEEESLIVCDGFTLEVARERLAKAEALCAAIGAMAEVQAPKRGPQCAWQMLTRVAAHSLDYDMSVCPPDSLEPMLGRLRHAMRSTAG